MSKSRELRRLGHGVCHPQEVRGIPLRVLVEELGPFDASRAVFAEMLGKAKP